MVPDDCIGRVDNRRKRAHRATDSSAESATAHFGCAHACVWLEMWQHSRKLLDPGTEGLALATQ